MRSAKPLISRTRAVEIESSKTQIDTGSISRTQVDFALVPPLLNTRRRSVDTILKLLGAIHYRPPKAEKRAIGVVNNDAINVAAFEQLDPGSRATRETSASIHNSFVLASKLLVDDGKEVVDVLGIHDNLGVKF